MIEESCGNDDCADDVELSVLASGQFGTRERIFAEQPQSIVEWLPSVSNHDPTLPSCCTQSTLSASCCNLSPQTPSSGESSSMEIPSVVVVEDSGILTSPESCPSPQTPSSGLSPSMEIPSAVVVEDSGISTSPESCLAQTPPMEIPSVVAVNYCGISARAKSRMSLLQKQLGMSLAETIGELNVTSDEPICRICHMPSDSTRPEYSTLVSPCRCTGSIQYVHHACLGVSPIK